MLFNGLGRCDSSYPVANIEAVNVGDMERTVSMIAGGFALLYGLSRLSLPGIVALVAGGALLSRGLSGHCSLYGALDVSTTDEPGHASPRDRKTDRAQRVTDVALAATGESPRGSRPDER